MRCRRAVARPDTISLQCAIPFFRSLSRRHQIKIWLQDDTTKQCTCTLQVYTTNDKLGSWDSDSQSDALHYAALTKVCSSRHKGQRSTARQVQHQQAVLTIHWLPTLQIKPSSDKITATDEAADPDAYERREVTMTAAQHRLPKRKSSNEGSRRQ